MYLAPGCLFMWLDHRDINIVWKTPMKSSKADVFAFCVQDGGRRDAPDILLGRSLKLILFTVHNHRVGMEDKVRNW